MRMRHALEVQCVCVGFGARSNVKKVETCIRHCSTAPSASWLSSYRPTTAYNSRDQDMSKMGDTSTQAPELISLANQVAGHPEGVQSLEGGRLVVKACLPRELQFYNEVKQAVGGKTALEARQVELLDRLLRVMPECYGSWNEYLGRQSGAPTESTSAGDAPRIVLENLTSGYDKPNVCDIKLGTQLWDEDASEEKRQRMEKAAANTTSGSHGIRLTGWQVSIICAAHRIHSRKLTF